MNNPPIVQKISGLQPTEINKTYNDLLLEFDKSIAQITDIISNKIDTIVSNIRIENTNILFDVTTGSDINNLQLYNIYNKQQQKKNKTLISYNTYTI